VIGVTSALDPHLLAPWVGNRVGIPYVGFKPLANTPVSTPRLVAGENTGVFIVLGDSNAASWVDGLYVPSNANAMDVVNVDDGGTYPMADPPFGCSFTSSSHGAIFTRVFDKMISNGVRQRTIAAMIGYGGSTLSDWEHSERLVVAPKRLRAVGLTETAYCMVLGANEVVLSYADALASLRAIIAVPRALGYNAPWFVATSTMNGGNLHANVAAAQAAVVDPTQNIFSLGTLDTLTGLSHRQADLTHLKATAANSGLGADAAADRMLAALTSHI